MKGRVTGREKCKRRQTVSDVSHVLTTVHNHPVASINKLYAKCSLLLMSNANTQHNTLTHTQRPSSFTLRTLIYKKMQLRQIEH